MPYAYGATIEHEFDADHLNIWLTFRHPMDQNLKPPLALWLLEEDDNPVDIIDSAWRDEFTLLLTSDNVADPPNRVLLEYNGPNSNLQATWGKNWEPWGPILSTDIGKAPCFVDRGDPAAADFGVGDFTDDGAWRDLDLSAIVPEHAKAITFTMWIRATAINKSIQFQEKGNVNSKNIAITTSVIANIVFRMDLLVALDDDRKCQYKQDVADWTYIVFTVKGWWF